MLGQSGYSHTCGVTGAENLNPSITYQWTKNNGTLTQIQIGADPKVLSFSSLRFSDAGQYTCQTTVSSPFLNNDITMTDSQDITLQSEFRCSIIISHLCIATLAGIYSFPEGYKMIYEWSSECGCVTLTSCMGQAASLPEYLSCTSCVNFVVDKQLKRYFGSFGGEHQVRAEMDPSLPHTHTTRLAGCLHMPRLSQGITNNSYYRVCMQALQRLA